jgi:L-seryl-tRNA(Ser) seleniumtransferase
VGSVRNPLRALPAVDRLLTHPDTAPLLERFSRALVTRQCRDVLADIRASIRGGDDVPRDSEILARVAERLRTTQAPHLQRVVNATGTVLHTNLGRAALPQAAIEALVAAATGPVNLEYDLDVGGRGRREALVEELIRELTGADAATVVNNNAAAVLVALNTLAAGREVVVSRGELIEIGGAFRIPEIMAGSGAVLREVGTTNRTHASDYEQAISERTGLILKVHTSNYRVVGFTADVGLPALVDIGRRRGVPVMEDLGSGALIDLQAYGLPREPVVRERIAAGATVVTFSGDKILGGPQAGLMAGTRATIDAVAKNPLHRAVRCGKLTIAALEATLRLYRDAQDIAAVIPTLRLLTRPLNDIESAAQAGLHALRHALGVEFRVEVRPTASQIGSGALPTDEIPSVAIAVAHAHEGADWMAARFRASRPPIIGRIHENLFLLDMRTIADPLDIVPHWIDDQERTRGQRRTSH